MGLWRNMIPILYMIGTTFWIAYFLFGVEFPWKLMFIAPAVPVVVLAYENEKRIERLSLCFDRAREISEERMEKALEEIAELKRKKMTQSTR